MLVRIVGIALGLLSSLLLLPLAKADVLPAAFIKEFVANIPAISGTWAPNPRRDGQPMILLTSKTGAIEVLEDPDESSDVVTILNLDSTEICANGERGLQTVVPHPDFQNNLLLYVFYSKFREGCLEDPVNGAYNVVARYSMDPTTLMLGNREEIWRGAPTTKKVHNGGAMVFGNDGMLYVSTGDGGDSKNSQMLNNTHGSIMRLLDDGSVPDDNPFSAQDGAVRCADVGGVTADGNVCSEVFAHGFRNPFRLAVDVNEKEKVKFTVSDVGGNYWEELDTVGTDFAGRNYGYPRYEGVCWHGTETRCPTPSDGMVEPFHWYAHLSTDDGGCVSGSVHVPDDLQWPSEYKFLFADFVFKEIYTLIEDAEAGCRTCRPPTSAYRNETFFQSENVDPDEERITDIFFAPYNNTQALYIIMRGGQQAVTRIRYTNLVDNAPPVPQIVMPETSGLFGVGDELEFDGSVSTDPDGDTLSFFWEFGDGETSIESSPTHSFAAPGEYIVTLTVTDTSGQEQQVSETIMIGEPPKVSILSPAEDEEFYVGEVFKLRGMAFDFRGQALPDEQLTWEVRQHHANHFHPFLDPTNGNNVELFGAPEPEDFFASTNSYLEIILTATDFNGLRSEVNLLVQPEKRNVTIDSNPPGVEVLVENYVVMTPTEIVSWQGHHLNILAKDVPPYLFRGWSDGETSAERKVDITENNQQILALYCAQDLWFCTAADECCGGFCVANTCESDAKSENHDWPADQESVGSTGESSGGDSAVATSKPEEFAEGQGDNAKSPNTTMTVIAVILALIVVASPFLIYYLRKRKQRLNAVKSRHASSKESLGNENQFSSIEKPAVAPALSTAALVKPPPTGKSKSAISKDSESVANSKSGNTACDYGSASSSGAASPAGSTTGDEVQEAISVEDDSRALDHNNDEGFVDIESAPAETASAIEANASGKTVVDAEGVNTSRSTLPAPPSPPTSVSKIEDLRQELAKAQSLNKELSGYISTSKSRLLAEKANARKDNKDDIESKDLEAAAKND